MARREGEHLVCSPCGEVAGRARMAQLAGPGGAAVALAGNEPYIIPMPLAFGIDGAAASGPLAALGNQFLEPFVRIRVGAGPLR